MCKMWLQVSNHLVVEEAITVCVCVCVRACVRACVCVHVCLCGFVCPCEGQNVLTLQKCSH